MIEVDATDECMNIVLRRPGRANAPSPEMGLLLDPLVWLSLAIRAIVFAQLGHLLQ